MYITFGHSADEENKIPKILNSFPCLSRLCGHGIPFAVTIECVHSFNTPIFIGRI